MTIQLTKIAPRTRTARDYFLLTLIPLAAIAGCNMSGGDQQAANTAPSGAPAAAAQPSAPANTLLAHDPAAGQTAVDPYPDPEKRPTMQAQVVLDRLGFTPGVVDGKIGASTRNAFAGFQEANNLTATGELDAPTTDALRQWTQIPATRVITVPADFAGGPFYKVPTGPADQAKMASLGYASLDEKLAERFHTTVATLKTLNPGGVPAGLKTTAPPSASPTPTASPSSASTDIPQPGPPSYFHGGQQIRVPNVGADAIVAGSVDDSGWAATLAMLGVGSDQPKVDKIVVSKSKGTLKGYDTAGKLIAMYTATMGSTHDPLPIGAWKVQGVDRDPKFHYNPALFWDAKPGDEKATLPAGPNGPVGVVWIDLDKPHYGIHGTPNPETIGRAESHGCVRLTNWDAARLAQMVKPGTQVLFEA